jgi:hypothetical protein
MHITFLSTSPVLYSPHTPMTFFPSWPFQDLNLVTLLPSSISSPWFSERTNGNWWVGFHIPFCFYTIPYFCKPLVLLSACLMLVSCLAYSLALKIEVIYSSKTMVIFQQITWHYISEDRIIHSVARAMYLCNYVYLNYMFLYTCCLIYLKLFKNKKEKAGSTTGIIDIFCWQYGKFQEANTQVLHYSQSFTFLL